MLIHAVQGHLGRQCFFRLDLEGVSLGHLGLCGTPLNPEQLEAFVGVDILCIPVGGEPGFTAEKASACIQRIEPRVVIPMAYLSENDPKAGSVESFIKEVGVPPQDAEKKLSIKKKDLPNSSPAPRPLRSPQPPPRPSLRPPRFAEKNTNKQKAGSVFFLLYGHGTGRPVIPKKLLAETVYVVTQTKSIFGAY